MLHSAELQHLNLQLQAQQQIGSWEAKCQTIEQIATAAVAEKDAEIKHLAGEAELRERLLREMEEKTKRRETEVANAARQAALGASRERERIQ